MDIKVYDALCITSSFLSLVILLVIKNITYCNIFISAAIFSLIWRIYRFKTDAQQNHPLFYLDLLFSFLTIYFCCLSNEISKVTVGVIVLLMIISWILKFINNIPLSNICHCIAHYLIVSYLLICLLNQ